MVYSGVTWHIYVILIRSYYCGCHVYGISSQKKKSMAIIFLLLCYVCIFYCIFHKWLLIDIACQCQCFHDIRMVANG